MGYDIFVFVARKAAEKFLCAVCQGVAKDVFETDCGHIFCRQCVGKLIRVTTTDQCSAQCPHCRECITWQNVHASKFLNREISQLQCKCNLCHGWTGNLSQLTPHQHEECPDQCIDCVWKKFGCKETKIKRKDINQHNEEFKVQHLELKINFLSKQHETQIQKIKKKYEQQIQQLNQEKICIEKKWKQKLISLHKKFGVKPMQNTSHNVPININHIEHMNISNTNTQIQKGDIAQYHSDGSISFDPNISSPLITSQCVSTVSTGRKKRKRSAMDESGSASDYGSNINDNSNNTSKRSKKRRRVNDTNANKNGGGVLNALMGNGPIVNKSKNSKVRNITTSNRKKQMSKGIATKRRSSRRRVHNHGDSDDEHHELIESSSESGSDSGHI